MTIAVGGYTYSNKQLCVILIVSYGMFMFSSGINKGRQGTIGYWEVN